MNKDLAIKASNALDSINEFEAFLDELDGVLGEFCLNASFKNAILTLADNELARLNKILEVL